MKARLFFSAGMILAAGSAAAATKVLQAFEGDGFGDWKVEGAAFGLAPVAGEMNGLNGTLTGYSQESVACSAHGGDAATGSLTSPEFEVSENYIVFLIAGGRHPGKVGAQLLVDGKAVREATGENSLQFKSQVWDVTEFRGKKARIRVFDEVTGSWGVIAADQFVLTDYPNYKFPSSTKGGKPHAAGLVASDAIPGMTIPEGVKSVIVADYQNGGVTSPTALAFGEKGEIYVTETHRFRHGVPDNRDHLYWYLDDLASQTVEDRRKMHEKWKDRERKASLEFLTEKEDMVRVLSKPGPDGKSAEAKIFAGKFNDLLDGPAAGVFAYEGTIYMACIPKIWALRDKNGDGVAEEREAMFDGFGVKVSFSGHDLNGFALGPDGRIYGTLGDRGMNVKTKEGKHYEYPDQGVVFRFDPDGTNFEVIHTGLRNPKEIAFDELGNAISVDNNSDQGDQARVVYIVDGGDSGWDMGHQALHSHHRQIGLESRPPNRWMDEKMWAPRSDDQPAYILPPVANLTSGPSGLTYHPGAGFLEEEAGRFLICDYRGGAANSGIYSFKVEPDGATMKMTNSRQMNWGAAVTDVEYSWDGKVVVTDFIGGWQSHENGRVYMLEAENTWRAEEAAEAAKLIAEGFESRSVKELAKLISHADMRVRLRAQLALTRKGQEGGKALMDAAKGDGSLLGRLHGVWGLGVIARRGSAVLPGGGGFAELPSARFQADAKKILTELLEDKDAEVRAQAIRALGEAGGDGNSLPFGLLLEDESSRVRFFAAIAAGRLKAAGALAYLDPMLGSSDDAYLRHAVAFALEGICQENQLAVYRQHSNPNLRMAGLVALRRQKSVHVVDFLADESPRIVDEAIRAIHDEGIEAARPHVAALLDGEVKERPVMIWRRLLHSAFRIGDATNLERVVKFAVNDKASEDARLEALRLLGEWAKPHPVDQSLGRWAPLPERDRKEIAGVLGKHLSELFKVEGRSLEPALALIGKYQIDLSSVPDEGLRTLVMNERAPGKGRSEALDLYAARKPQGLDQLLQQLAGGKDDDLAIAALRRLAADHPAAALEGLRQAVSSGSAHRQQEAWGVAVELKSAAELIVAKLGELREKKGVSPAALELLEAAEKRNEPAVKKALKDYKAALTASDDPLAQWLGSLEGGDVEKGGALFESHPAGQCMRCHAGGHGGGEAGPDLSAVAKKGDRRFLLESLVNPGAKVAEGYGIASVTLKGGKNVAGLVIADTPEHVDLDATGKVLRVRRGDIESMTPPVSAMPPMGALMSARELRDIVAWLASRNGEEPKPKERPEPELVTP